MTGQDYLPRWSKFPNVPAGSVGWRMGPAKGYYDTFYRWFSALEASAQAQYELAHPEPRGWKRFYRRLTDRPWTSSQP